MRQVTHNETPAVMERALPEAGGNWTRMPEALSREIVDGAEPVKLEAGGEFQPGHIVRLIAPDMIAQSVVGGEVMCAPADPPGSLSETSPDAAFRRIAARRQTTSSRRATSV